MARWASWRSLGARVGLFEPCSGDDQVGIGLGEFQVILVAGDGTLEPRDPLTGDIADPVAPLLPSLVAVIGAAGTLAYLAELAALHALDAGHLF